MKKIGVEENVIYRSIDLVVIYTRFGRFGICHLPSLANHIS